MVNVDEIYIVNYCHPKCTPFKNIVRLPKEEAFSLAYELSIMNKGEAFFRFGDFENYYPLRIETDKYLYNAFISLGGKPKVEHPLSFVLHGSEYLYNWFGKGIITKVPLKNIPSEFISFTLGDSAAILKRTGKIPVLTKDMLLRSISQHNGTFDEYMHEIEKNYYYIEVQLWNDDYCKC